MVSIYDGSDTTITTADEGTTNNIGLGGVGQRDTRYSVDEKRAEAASSAVFAGELGCTASVFKNVYFTTPYGSGDGWRSDVEITINGFYSALLDSIAGGSRIRMTAFARTSDSIEEEEEIEDKVSSTFDVWSNNENFSTTLDFNALIGEPYEIGVKVRTKASALSTAAAHADVATSGGLLEYTGRIRYDTIEINWQ